MDFEASRGAGRTQLHANRIAGLLQRAIPHFSTQAAVRVHDLDDCSHPYRAIQQQAGAGTRNVVKTAEDPVGTLGLIGPPNVHTVGREHPRFRSPV
jgi:hypothetical protein